MGVFTIINMEDLKKFVAKYDIGDVTSFAGISEGSDNTNYTVNTTTGNFVLTIFEERINKEYVDYCMDLQSFLHKNGIDCPMPKKTKSGEIIPLFESAGKYALIADLIKGETLKHDHISKKHCQKAGSLMAMMHKKSARFKDKRMPKFCLKELKKNNKAIIEKADMIRPKLAAKFIKELNELENKLPKNIPSGPIHADATPSNFLFDETNEIQGIIDFYFSHQNAFLFDLMTTINFWCFDKDENFNSDIAKWLIESYHNKKGLKNIELEHLALFGRISMIYFALYRLFNVVNTNYANIKAENLNMMDRFFKRLEFHKNIKHYSDYGLNI
jgi:homoserine kinase type II